MRGNMDSHPDMVQLMQNLETAVSLHERNQKLAAGLVTVGSGLVTLGLFVAGAEQLRLKLGK